MDFGVFDIETYGNLDDDFKFGVVYYSPNNFKIFDDKDEMLQHIIYHNCNLWYAHNLEFDVSKLTDNFFEEGDFFIYSMGLLYYTIKNTEFRDSYALLPLPLRKLGSKTETPFELLQNKYISKLEIDYCINDCEILYQSIHKFLNEIKVIRQSLSDKKKRQWKKIPYTIASCGLKIHGELGYTDQCYRWRKDNKRVKFKFVEKTDKYYNRSYFGGRCENFYIGGINNVYVYDINSLYPFAMKMNIPVSKKSIYINRPKWDNIKDLYGVAYIVAHQTGDIPFLPIRSSKLFFPKGKIEGLYNINEIKYGLENGLSVDKIRYAWVTEHSFNFSNYVDPIYKKRLELKQKNDPRQIFYKLLLNSGYGKYGQKNEVVDRLVFDNNDKLLYWIMENKDDCEKIETIGNNRLIAKRKTKHDYKIHSNLSIPSYITSYARITLHSHIKSLLSKGYNVYYCDTDSIFTDCPPKKYPFKISNKKLGSMKFEGKYYANIRAPKYYMLKDMNEEITYKIKGVRNPSSFTDIYDNEQYIKVKTAFRNYDQMYQKRDISPYKILKWRENQKRFFKTIPPDDKLRYDHVDSYPFNSHQIIDL